MLSQLNLLFLNLKQWLYMRFVRIWRSKISNDQRTLLSNNSQTLTILVTNPPPQRKISHYNGEDHMAWLRGDKYLYSTYYTSWLSDPTPPTKSCSSEIRKTSCVEYRQWWISKRGELRPALESFWDWYQLIPTQPVWSFPLASRNKWIPNEITVAPNICSGPGVA